MFAHMVDLRTWLSTRSGPDPLCSDVDRAVRAYFEEHELWSHWRHHTGHAIGLRYHEGPFLDSGDRHGDPPGMVFTVEPGLYSPSWAASGTPTRCS
jgi:Xaa-Pro aminopeptidase